MENCCRLCGKKAKPELTEMLSESIDEEVECKALSDDETIIPDNIQAQIPLGKP